MCLVIKKHWHNRKFGQGYIKVKIVFDFLYLCTPNTNLYFLSFLPYSLSPSELESLTILYKKEKNKNPCQPDHFILLLHHGYSGSEIPSIHHLDQNTITIWKKRYLERSEDASWIEDPYQSYFGELSLHPISLLRC